MLHIKRTKRGHIRDRNNKTLVVSGFPGVGKSEYCRTNPKDILILDSDSSKFDKASFPENYIEYIKSNLGGVDIIFISTHAVVRKALSDSGIKCHLVYPDRKLKDEYLARYKSRDSNDVFISILHDNWDNFLNELENDNSQEHIVLKSGEFISNYIYVN